jgi:hypothetical protein
MVVRIMEKGLVRWEQLKDGDGSDEKDDGLIIALKIRGESRRLLKGGSFIEIS